MITNDLFCFESLGESCVIFAAAVSLWALMGTKAIFASFEDNGNIVTCRRGRFVLQVVPRVRALPFSLRRAMACWCLDPPDQVIFSLCSALSKRKHSYSGLIRLRTKPVSLWRCFYRSVLPSHHFDQIPKPHFVLGPLFGGH